MKKTCYQIPATKVCFMESVSFICTSPVPFPDGGGGNPEEVLPE